MNTVYLDHAATTPTRPEVREAMEAIEEPFLGNPSSVHRWGREARRALEDARERVATALCTESPRVHFVRGGTESISLAILGRTDWLRCSGISEPRLLYSSLEHSAVRECMEAAAAAGCSVATLPVSPTGTVSLADSIGSGTGEVHLLSVQWVNQETGLILPIDEIARIAHEAGVPLHVDAVQAAGRVEIDLDRTPISFLSLSGHKLGGPPGAGVLIVDEDFEIHPRLFGGGQERGLRPGTEDVVGAVGLAQGLEIAVARMEREAARLTALRRILEEGLSGSITGLRIHGAEGYRAPHILHVGIPGLPRDLLPGALDLAGVGVSAGSACNSGSTEVSPVMLALYGTDAERFAPLRLSLGWPTTEMEVREVVQRIPEVVAKALAS